MTRISLVRIGGISVGIDAEPAWSSDGSGIAFASNRDGNFEINTTLATGTVR